MTGQILVVEDDAEVRTLLSRHLRRVGYTVLEAGDGVEALALVEKGVPDVAVTDMAMPRLDGLGLLKELQKRDPDLPVIVLTGQGSFANALQAVREGALFDYLMKPLPDLTLLEVAVRRAVEVRQLRARAREADQVIAMRELAVTAADRILNPLNIMNLSLVILKSEGFPPEARTRAVARIEQAIGTIVQIIRQMGSITRYAPSKVHQGLRQIDLDTATAQELEAE